MGTLDPHRKLPLNLNEAWLDRSMLVIEIGTPKRVAILAIARIIISYASQKHNNIPELFTFLTRVGNIRQ